MVVMSVCARAAQTYDVAAFYWPSLHYDKRWATFFPDGSQGEWESIRNCKPKWEGHWQPRVPGWGYLMDKDLSEMVPTVAKGNRPGALWVLKAQWDAQKAIPNAKMVIIRDLEQHPGDFHLSTAGILEHGRILAEAYLDMAK